MSKRYANPPIVEVSCEFQLSQDTPWDLTIPGLMYEQIKKEFQHREQRSFSEIRINNEAREIQQQTNININKRILFFTNDKKMFVQVGTNFLSINCLAPYSSWDNFKSKIEKAFHALKEVVDIKGLQRIGLRYVNRIEIPGQSVKLEDFFEFRPFLGSMLPQNITSYIIGCAWPFSDGRDMCRVQLTNAVPNKPEDIASILDLDYFLARPQGILPNQVQEWVDDAHQQIESLFEGCIANRLREIFGEVK